MVLAVGMDGLDTYRAILKVNSSQKAIVMSGYAETDRVRELLHLGAGQFIKKPFTPATLGNSARVELDKVASPESVEESSLA